MKLRPAYLEHIGKELNSIAGRHGGEVAGKYSYRFLPSLGDETARKTAEAAMAMHTFLMQHTRKLHGITVLVDAGDDAGENHREGFLLRIIEEDGLWVVPDVAEDFRDYFEGRESEGFLRVSGLKAGGARLSERLPRILLLPDRLALVRRNLEKLERKENNRTVLLLRGQPGSGKRATLSEALRSLYPGDHGAALVIPFSDDAEDPMEPFIRALKSSAHSPVEFLSREESIWWKKHASPLLDQLRQGGMVGAVHDQGPVDLIQGFILWVKGYVEQRRREGRPAYLVIDGFTLEKDAGKWLQHLLGVFLNLEYFRLILIQDSPHFNEPWIIPKQGYEVYFAPPSDDEWAALIRNESITALSNGVQESLKKRGANLYRFFHAVLVREEGLSESVDPGEALVESLDEESRLTLFLIHASGGLANRTLLMHRLGQDEEKRNRENARCSNLMNLGLFREDFDGQMRLLPGGPGNFSVPASNFASEAESFGEFLYKRFDAGEPVHLLRLYRYLKQWGPGQRVLAVLNKLLENLLDTRRLRLVGRLLKNHPFSPDDWDGVTTEALQNLIGATRLRYVLLTDSADGIRSLLRTGTIPLISGRGAYSDRFRLQNARLFYTMGRWNEAFTASREALSSFQKSGDHRGETDSHLELGLNLLAQGRLRDALEHFGIARRIGEQIYAVLGVLRAAALETLTLFLLGNLTEALWKCREYRASAKREGRRDIWLLLTLIAVRIAWELGRCDEVVAYAEEGRYTANFYSLNAEENVMTVWKGRGLMLLGRRKGRQLLLDAVESGKSAREARAFLAEAAWFAGKGQEAREHIREAAKLDRISVRMQGEADDWSDGLFPVEGRLAESSSPLDAMGEWIGCFGAFLAAEEGETGMLDRLEGMLDREGRLSGRPFSHQYAYWTALVTPGDDAKNRCMNQALKEIHSHTGRSNDNQTTQAWLNGNPWNKRLMDEARQRKFL